MQKDREKKEKERKSVPPAISRLQISQLSTSLPYGLLQTLFPDILLKVVHELEDPENWEEIFENYPTGLLSSGNPETTLDGNGCVVTTSDAKYKIAEKEKSRINGTIYTIENTGGGASSATLGATLGGFGGTVGGGGPTRLYIVMEYKVGPKFFYHFIVKAKVSVTICPLQAPQVSTQIVSGEWVLANYEEEALISVKPVSGGLEDETDAITRRRTLRNQHPGSTTSSSTLGIDDN